MHPRPIVVGLTLCDHVIVEEKTKKISLIGAFTGLSAPAFPARVPPFSVFTVLTDGSGSATIKLLVTHMDTNEEVYSHEGVQFFPNKVAEVRYHLRLRQFAFPAAGSYQFTLLVDGEWMAHRRLRVYQREIEE